MNSEEVGFEKIERMLMDAGLLESRPVIFSNILRKKNSILARRSSEGHYSVLSGELNLIYKTLRGEMRRCKYVEDSNLKKQCRDSKRRLLIEKVTQIQTQCHNLRYHQARCDKRCNTIITMLQNQLNK